jgi:hypothetical protein
LIRGPVEADHALETAGFPMGAVEASAGNISVDSVLSEPAVEGPGLGRLTVGSSTPFKAGKGSGAPSRSCLR